MRDHKTPDPTRRGLGEIKLRGTIWWLLRDYRHGRRVCESSRSTEQGVAATLLKRRIKELGSGVHVTPSKAKLKVEDGLKAVSTDYLINKRRSRGHVDRRITKHLAPFFSGRRLAAVSKGDVISYTAERLEAGAANASINRELAILKRTFKLADVQRPAFAMLREDNVRQGFFERDQMEPCSAIYPPRSSRSSSSPTSPAGACRAKCCRCNGGTSTSTPGRSGSTPARRRTPKGGRFRSRRSCAACSTRSASSPTR
jgi:hypothetical protein